MSELDSRFRYRSLEVSKYREGVGITLWEMMVLGFYRARTKMATLLRVV